MARAVKRRIFTVEFKGELYEIRRDPFRRSAIREVVRRGTQRRDHIGPPIFPTIRLRKTCTKVFAQRCGAGGSALVHIQDVQLVTKFVLVINLKTAAAIAGKKT